MIFKEDRVGGRARVTVDAVNKSVIKEVRVFLRAQQKQAVITRHHQFTHREKCFQLSSELSVAEDLSYDRGGLV